MSAASEDVSDPLVARLAAADLGAWRGECQGLEGDPLEEIIARHMARHEGRAWRPPVFECDWCKRPVDRSSDITACGRGLRSSHSAAGEGPVPVSSKREQCCAGVWWQDEIALCCLCYNVPDPGTPAVCPSCCAATLPALTRHAHVPARSCRPNDQQFREVRLGGSRPPQCVARSSGEETCMLG